MRLVASYSSTRVACEPQTISAHRLSPSEKNRNLMLSQASTRAVHVGKPD